MQSQYSHSLKRFLDIESLQGKTFLDIGSGSKNTIEGATTKCPKGMSVSIEFRRAGGESKDQRYLLLPWIGRGLLNITKEAAATRRMIEKVMRTIL